MFIFYCLSHLNLHLTGFQNPIESLITEESENAFSGNCCGLQLPGSVPGDKYAPCVIQGCWAMKPGISLWHLWASHYCITQALHNLKRICPVSWWSNVFLWHWVQHCHRGSLAQSKKVGLDSSKYQLIHWLGHWFPHCSVAPKKLRRGWYFIHTPLSPLYTLLYIRNHKAGWKPMNFSSTWGIKCETWLNSSLEVICSLGERLHFTCTWSGCMSRHKPTPTTCATNNPFSPSFWGQIEDTVWKMITTWGKIKKCCLYICMSLISVKLQGNNKC